MTKLIISHRGNISGPIPHRENQPSYINEALSLGYNVEVDVWLLNNIFYLGHDKPEYIVNYEFFQNPNIWTHCKNLNALDHMILDPEVNCFAHNTDDYVITSKMYIWCYPKKQLLTENCIAVMPELVKSNTWDLSRAAGICTNHILKYSTNFLKGNYFS